MTVARKSTIANEHQVVLRETGQDREHKLCGKCGIKHCPM